MIRFTVHEAAVGKGRPRFSMARGYVQTYTPKKTAGFETLVRNSFLASGQDPITDEKQPLMVTIVARYSYPKRTPKKRRWNYSPMMSKPDIDNIAKSILDALNGVAFPDDKQICRLTVEKTYVDEPSSISITICDWD